MFDKIKDSRKSTIMSEAKLPKVYKTLMEMPSTTLFDAKATSVTNNKNKSQKRKPPI